MNPVYLQTATRIRPRSVQPAARAKSGSRDDQALGIVGAPQNTDQHPPKGGRTGSYWGNLDAYRMLVLRFGASVVYTSSWVEEPLLGAVAPPWCAGIVSKDVLARA